MAISFEQALIDVWQQVLVENADVVVLGTKRYPVRLFSTAIGSMNSSRSAPVRRSARKRAQARFVNSPETMTPLVICSAYVRMPSCACFRRIQSTSAVTRSNTHTVIGGKQRSMQRRLLTFTGTTCATRSHRDS